MSYYKKRQNYSGRSRRSSGTGQLITGILVVFLVISLVPMLFSLGSSGNDQPKEPSTSPTEPGPELVSGVVSTYYYTGQNCYQSFSGEYDSISVTAKNFLPMEKSYEGYNKPNDGFGMVLFMEFDNGKLYAFWIANDDEILYKYNHFGLWGDAGWANSVELGGSGSEMAELINGDGVEFTVSRVDSNLLEIRINGILFETYYMEDITSSNKVVSVGFRHSGNAHTTIEVPYVLTKA